MLQSGCATCHTTSDGWIAVRDEHGHLWCEYHPGRKVIRNYARIRNGRGYTEEYHGEIAIDDLIAGLCTARRIVRQK